MGSVDSNGIQQMTPSRRHCHSPAHRGEAPVVTLGYDSSPSHHGTSNLFEILMLGCGGEKCHELFCFRENSALIFTLRHGLFRWFLNFLNSFFSRIQATTFSESMQGRKFRDGLRFKDAFSLFCNVPEVLVCQHTSLHAHLHHLMVVLSLQRCSPAPL